MGRVGLDEFMDNLLQAANEGVNEMRAAMAYQGSNKEYMQRGNIGKAAVTSYARIFASITNREILNFTRQRYLDGQVVRELPSGQ